MKEPHQETLSPSDPAFERLKAHVIATTGLAYFSTREADLVARLRRRFAATGVSDCTRYLELLHRPASGEQEALIRELTIGETHFFRFQEQFDALREHVVPELIRANAAARQLRIWSAGCATGPEPYSLALLLDQEFPQLSDWNISILGTDLNREFLRRAEEGVFAEWSLRGLPETLRRDCFSAVPVGWRIDARFRQRVRFQPHNLVEDAYPGGPDDGFDIILCRNVLIYFDEETIRRVIAGLRARLAPGGWLLLGHAETSAELAEGFTARPMQGTILYQKTGRSGGALPPPLLWTATARPTPPAITGATPFDELLAWRPYPLGAAKTEDTPFVLPEVPASRLATPAAAPEGPSADGEMERLRGLLDSGSWSEAEQCAAGLLEREPLNPLAHFLRALVLAQTGTPAAAEAALRRALFLESDFGLAYYHLGLLLAARGDQPAAFRAFRNTLRAVAALPDDAVLDGADLTAGQLREAASLHLRESAA